MKKLNKVLIILLLIITVFLIPSRAYADTIDIFGAGRDFITHGKEQLDFKVKDVLSGEWLNKLTDKGGDWLAKGIFMEIIDALWAIGLLVIFISTVVLGIKYMFVLPEEKSRIKQATTPYIIGVVIIFGALTIWKFLITILDGSI